MKKIVSLSLSLLFLSISISAQVTGYMGKRFFVGYSNLFSPTIERLSSDEFQIKRLNISHALDLNYIIQYRMALGFSFSYVKSKIDNAVVANYNLHDYIFTDPENNAQSSSLGFSLGIKLFKRSYLAPLGPYVKWEGFILLNSIKYEPYTYPRVSQSYYQTTSETISIGSGELKSKSFGLAFGFGRQRIFYDKLLIDYGIRAAIAITVDDYYNKMYSSYETDLSPIIFNKIFFQQLVNLRLGIGF